MSGIGIVVGLIDHSAQCLGIGLRSNHAVVVAVHHGRDVVGGLTSSIELEHLGISVVDLGDNHLLVGNGGVRGSCTGAVECEAEVVETHPCTLGRAGGSGLIECQCDICCRGEVDVGRGEVGVAISEGGGHGRHVGAYGGGSVLGYGDVGRAERNDYIAGLILLFLEPAAGLVARTVETLERHAVVSCGEGTQSV